MQVYAGAPKHKEYGLVNLKCRRDRMGGAPRALKSSALGAAPQDPPASQTTATPMEAGGIGQMNELETLIDSGPGSHAATMRNRHVAPAAFPPLSSGRDIDVQFDALTHSTVGKTELASDHMGQEQELKDEVHDL